MPELQAAHSCIAQVTLLHTEYAIGIIHPRLDYWFIIMLYM